jgi:hypothetical protein
MADVIIEFDSFETIVADMQSGAQFYVDAIRCEQYDSDDESYYVVFLDRDSHTHSQDQSGEMVFSDNDRVEVVGLHTEWVEFDQSDDDDVIVSAKGAVGIAGTSGDIDSLVDCDMYLDLVARMDGDNPVLPCTFEPECSGTLNAVDHDWTP